MSYRPCPDDIRCAGCGEWFHKALKSCPMCDAPKVSHATVSPTPTVATPVVPTVVVKNKKPRSRKVVIASGAVICVLIGIAVARAGEILPTLSSYLQASFKPIPPELQGELHLSGDFLSVIPVATQKPEDVGIFLRAEPARMIGGGSRSRAVMRGLFGASGGGSSFTQEELLGSGRVFRVEPGTTAKVISADPGKDGFVFVVITSGVNQGHRGYVPKWMLYKAPMQPVYPPPTPAPTGNPEVDRHLIMMQKTGMG